MKKNLYLSDRAQESLTANGFDLSGSGISERANDIFDRYLTIIEQTDPGLTEAEELAVIDAHWSHWFHSAELDMNLDHNVEDSLQDGLAEKWDIDGQTLVTKLQSLNAAQRMTLVERIEKRKSASTS